MSRPFPRHNLGAPRKTLTNKLGWKICRRQGISTWSICQWRGCSGRCEDPSGPSEAPSSWRNWIHCSGPGGPLFCLASLLLSECGFSCTQPSCWPQTHCSFHPASWFLREAFHTHMGTVGSKHKGKCQAWRGRGRGAEEVPTTAQNHKKHSQKDPQTSLSPRILYPGCMLESPGKVLKWPHPQSILDEFKAPRWFYYVARV